MTNVLPKVTDERNALLTRRRKKANWIGHILFRNWLLKHNTEGKTEGTQGRERTRRQSLADLKEKTRFWKLKEDVLHRTLWRTRCTKSCAPAVRQCGDGENKRQHK